MTKPAGLTPKREKFAHAVASGKSQAQAYREAFTVAKMAPKTVVEHASRLMADRNVRARVEELRAPIAEKAQITLESHLRDLLALRNLAAKEKQMAAAISAEIARGKASGVADDRLRVLGPDGGPLQQITRIELVARKL
jgi:hypothetical protein